MICYLFPQPTYFIFSPDVPALLYYAHIPTVTICFLFSLYIFWKDKSSLINQLLLSISVLFLLWTTTNLIAWTNINSSLVMFVWSFFGTIQGLIAILFIYLTYVFLEKKDISTRIKAIFFTLLIPTVLLASTSLNLSGFDLTACDAFKFEWPTYKLYSAFLGVVAIVWIFVLLVRKYQISTQDFKKQISLFGMGVELALLMFFGMEFLAAYFTKIGLLPDSGIEIYGMFGVSVFIVYLNILVVRFNVFNVKLVGTQALMIGLIALITSKLFTTETGASRTITIVTIAGICFFGYFLVVSVKKEIETREKIERLATDLERANARLRELDRQKTEFVSIASHQLRAPLTAIKGYLSMVLEGDYGNVVEGALRETLERTFESTNNLVTIVSDFLDVSRIEQGRMVYDWSDFDLKSVAETVVHELTEPAQKRKLSLTFSVEPGTTFMVHGDKNKLKQVFTNLVDNSIKYTPAGKVEVSVSRPLPKVVRFMVKDTGIGMDKSTLVKLFEKFSRANDASQTNAIGTGLGLFVAKEMIKAHEGGKIWAESEGKGKGSSFIVELRGL